jgi:1,4-dihydroxy-2-naphthoate octaprenyltransferase
MKIKSWISAFRLRTLPLSLSGIVLGSFIALNDTFWNWGVFTFSILTTILFQIVSNLANDLGDTLKGADNEGRVGPIRSVQSGQIKVGEMKKAVFIFSLLSLISAGVLIYLASIFLTFNLIITYLILAVFCVIAALMYTIGKKAYGYHGLGDLFVFIFFGLVSILGVYTLYTNDFNSINFLPACAIGFLSTAVLNLNNMRDQINDKLVSKNTLVVKIGASKAVLYHFFLIISAVVLLGVFMYAKKDVFGLTALLPSFILLKHLSYVKHVKQDFVKFDTELKKVALTTFLLSVTCSIVLSI